MTALAADRQHVQYLDIGARVFPYPVKANTQIYKWGLVCIDTNGFLVPAADTANYVCVGFAKENVLGGATDGAKECAVISSVAVKCTGVSFTQASVGSTVYVADDGTVTATPTNYVRVGIIVKYVSSTVVWVYVATGAAVDLLPNTSITGAKIASATITPTQLAAKSKRQTAKSGWFNIDNGAGTTIDDVIIRPSTAITITAARAVYVDATTGTVAAATVQLGTAVGGTQIVAATNLENSKAVGAATALTIASGAVAANTPVCVRHTGIAATAAGQYYVEIEYSVDA